NLDFWSLGLAPLGSSQFVEIARGDGPVNAQALTQLDPATLANGFYQLRLTAADIAGRQSVATATVEVDPAAKPGAVGVTDPVLVVSLGGTTVSLVRQYDSLQAHGLQPVGFGPGWRLVNRDVQIQIGVAPTGKESFGLYAPLQDGTRLYLTLPSGDRVG